MQENILSYQKLLTQLLNGVAFFLLVNQMVKDLKSILSLVNFILQGDGHELLEISGRGLLFKLSDNNTIISETTLHRLAESIKLNEKLNYVKIYSDHGSWFLDISITD